MSQFRLARLGLMLAAVGLCTPLLMTTAHAQDKAAAPAAAAAPADTVRPELFKLLDPAAIKQLMDAKNYAEVQSRVTQAEAVANRTPYEDYVLNRMKLSLGSSTNNNALAMPALEAVINSGRLSPAEQTNFIEALANMHYNAKDYPKAIEWFKRYQKESSTPNKVNASLVRAYYLSGDNAGAKALLLPSIEATEKAGQAPSEEDLRLLASAALKQKDDAAYLVALEKLVTYHPSDDFWTDVLSRGVARKPGFDNNTNAINYLRLEFAALKKLDAQEYVDLAEIAMRDGFPTEAKKALDAGFAAGVLSTKAHTALRDKANKGAADDAKNIASGEASASKSKTGAGLVNLGWAYATMDQADKGAGFIQQGIAKGGLKNAEEAKLRLGMAQARAGKNAEAISTFQTVKGGGGAGDLAKYWIVLLQQKQRGGGAQTAAN